MAHWGPGVFENDRTLGWIADLCGGDTVDPVIRTLKVVVDAPAHQCIENSIAFEALAAAEVVAAALGRPSPYYFPPEAANWLTRHQMSFGPDVIDLARRAVRRVRTFSEATIDVSSEFAEAWLRLVIDLQERLEEQPSITR
jgi:hypothetical protein